MRKMAIQAREKLILALDVDTQEEVEGLVEKLADFVGIFKVGHRLFTRYGPKIIKVIKKKKVKVFYDAKFYDISSVVEKAAETVADLGVDMFTMHTLGGLGMIQRARKAAKKRNRFIKVLGVTLLTSLNSQVLEEELGIERNLKEEVIHLANLAKKGGLDGVVASSYEIEELRRNFGNDLLLIVPGVRPRGSKKDEQKRVLTPRQAIKRGADFVVIGRPILDSADPVRTAKRILEEIED